MSVGHDEYWSDIARANFETARDNGVHLAFFSGNEVYWKTRWEADWQESLFVIRRALWAKIPVAINVIRSRCGQVYGELRRCRRQLTGQT